ncbi:MAG: hypothetical protein P8I51_07665 [Polaribacter sp.]|nr:hypothetical protein [Polaribacter sp.]MDG1954753.1 hypothetical protein [Polaribacter sp.]MDG2074493.1 hypothetical protein [Polaribacter sp.]
MEKKHEITAKQLAFLDRFLKNHNFGSEDDKIELKDHIISDFEINGNGNLSQYLSEELSFIKKFIGNKLRAIHKSYRRKTIDEALSFFTSIKKLPITVAVFLIIYFLTMNLNGTILIVSFFISVLSFFIYSQFFLNIKKKDRKKLDRIEYLGQEMWLPYLMIMFPLGFLEDIVINKYFFTVYWFVAIAYSVAAIIVMKKEKAIIYEKYKHLLS